jgi:2-polyprenyl-6-methoxyphenol hydroxylase-like FAD-dependent oxidoreductase
VTTSDRYDVIIVGGRPAGGSLAARLGARGLSVLVVDKAEFPSHPEVPSCPLMYSSAMRLLDEIGFRESEYAAASTRIRKGVVGFEGYFHVTFGLPMAHGRDYFYGFDRGRFDHALWNHLGTFPSITRRSGFVVSNLIREADRVVGIEGAQKGAHLERFDARLAVVGADGRHSLIARKAGARVIEDQAEYTSTIHFAEWEGLAPATPDGEPALQIVSTGKGRNVLFFPSCEGRVSVATHVRTDRADTGGNAQEYYDRQLRSLATVHRRLEGARQIGPLLGVRRIANRYRDHGGPGWVLVGDAVHHKDPIDGQGIYDALVEARHLAELLVAVHEQRLSWDALLERYGRAVIGETHDMFEATMKRLVRDLYSDTPPLMIRTLIRWALEDPEYQRRFLLFLTRVLPPEKFRTPSLMAGAAARGVLRDLRGLLPRTRTKETR